MKRLEEIKKRAFFSVRPQGDGPGLIVDADGLAPNFIESDKEDIWEVQYLGEFTDEEIDKLYPGEHPGW